MTRSALIVIGALSLAPSSAQAQDSGTTLLYTAGMIIGASPGLFFDIFILKNLVEDGVVRKGFSVNATVFGSLALLIGGVAGYSLLTDTRIQSGFGSGFLSVGAIGAGTAVLGMWGLFHPRPPPVEHHLDEGPVEPSRPPADLPPQPPPYSPPPEPGPQVMLVPQLRVVPGGGLVFGIAGTL